MSAARGDTPALRVRGLTYGYPRAAGPVWRDVDLDLHSGSVLVLLGTNGAGKSTLLDCLAGLRTPQAGSVELAGRLLADTPTREVARHVALVPQHHDPTYPFTVLEVAMMGRSPYHGAFSGPDAADRDRALAVLARLGLDALADRPYTQLSGGQRQQVIIARALVQDTEVLLFDEPTSGLDFGNQYRYIRLLTELAAEGHAVVVTTHSPEHCLIVDDQVGMLDGGRLTVGPAAELVTAERLSALYGVDVTLGRLPGLDRTVAAVRGARSAGD